MPFFFLGSLCFSCSLEIVCHVNLTKIWSVQGSWILHSIKLITPHWILVRWILVWFISLSRPMICLPWTNSNDSPLKSAFEREPFAWLRNWRISGFQGVSLLGKYMSYHFVVTCSIQKVYVTFHLVDWNTEFSRWVYSKTPKFNNLPLKEILVETSLSFWIVTVKLQGVSLIQLAASFLHPLNLRLWSKPGGTSPDRFTKWLGSRIWVCIIFITSKSPPPKKGIYKTSWFFPSTICLGAKTSKTYLQRFAPGKNIRYAI